MKPKDLYLTVLRIPVWIMPKPRLQPIFFFLFLSITSHFGFSLPLFLTANESPGLIHFLPSFYDLCPFLPIPAAVTRIQALAALCLKECGWL